jgi:hypothetical protein
MALTKGRAFPETTQPATASTPAVPFPQGVVRLSFHLPDDLALLRCIRSSRAGDVAAHASVFSPGGTHAKKGEFVGMGDFEVVPSLLTAEGKPWAVGVDKRCK